MPNINIFDTSIHTDNLGDVIIMEAVYGILREIFPKSSMEFFATHDHRKSYQYPLPKKEELGFIGGTNILSHATPFHHNWNLTFADLKNLRNLILFGTGWSGYKTTVSIFGNFFYKKILSQKYFHAVRDMHTFDALSKIMGNVLYTGCPTTWQLTPSRCAQVSRQKGRHVVFALTCYHPNPELDRALYTLLQSHYEKIYFWPQMHEDAVYARKLGINGMTIIPPLVEFYDEILDKEDVDVIGSRLHGGIRALQRGRRALIMSVDNRAREMGRTTRLPVIERDQIDQAKQWILNPTETVLTLPIEAIERWKGQFQDMGAGHHG